MSESLSSTSTIDTVIKLGGGLVSEPRLFAEALSAIHRTARRGRLLVVPGGGAFADQVRELDRRVGLSDDAAHWMAIGAMDQTAHLIAEGIEDGVLVRDAGEIPDVFECGQVPVLAPCQWLQRSDPLPHSWDVTSDSIAAWVAGEVGAVHLVLIKPPGTGIHRSEDQGTPGLDLVDPWFSKALPTEVAWTMVAADRADEVLPEIRGEQVRSASITP